MTRDIEPWTFGETPLPQTVTLAPLLRRVAGLAAALEQEHPAVDELVATLAEVEQALRAAAPSDLAPRIGPSLTPEQRVYLDHARDIGAYNPVFPEYTIEVAGQQARGTVNFPLAFEGPPGIVHGGLLGTFFDCVIQHHNCDLGEAGKTSSLHVEYRRPTPLLTALDFTVDRETDGHRITSTAAVTANGKVLCSAVMQAVAGRRDALPEVSGRRVPS